MTADLFAWAAEHPYGGFEVTTALRASVPQVLRKIGRRQ